MSRTFSTNCGSLENLKFSTRCGCNPNARQIRTMAVCDNPGFSAINRLLQCVLLSGIDSSVRVMTCSTCFHQDTFLPNTACDQRTGRCHYSSGCPSPIIDPEKTCYAAMRSYR